MLHISQENKNGGMSHFAKAENKRTTNGKFCAYDTFVKVIKQGLIILRKL